MNAKRTFQQGVMLLEALIAILIFTVGILALIGMQSRAIAYVADAKYRSDAAFLADEIISKMWVDRTNLASYASGTAANAVTWASKVAATLPCKTAGACTPTIAVAGNQVTVTVIWYPPSATGSHSYSAIAQITDP